MVTFKSLFRSAVWGFCAVAFLAGIGVMQAQAQPVVFDIESARTLAGRTVRVPLDIFVQSASQPAQFRLVLAFEAGMLTPVTVVDGPSLITANKRSSFRVLSSSSLEITVQGFGTESISTGTLVYVDFRVDPNHLPRITPLRFSDALVTDRNGVTIPSATRTGIVVVNRGFYEPKEIFFAQVASGLQSLTFGGYETSIILTNTGTGTGARLDGGGEKNLVLVEFFSEQGQAMNIDIAGNYDNIFYYELNPQATIVLDTKNPGGIKEGWIRVTSTLPMGGNVLYSYVDLAGQVRAQTGILPSSAVVAFAATVDTRGNMVIGLAVGNLCNGSTGIEMELREDSGTQRSRKTATLAGQSKTAHVLGEIFPEVDLRNFVGRVNVRSTDALCPLIATTLRFSDDLSIFTSQQVVVMQRFDGVDP